MSTEERVTQLEGQAEKLTEPETECFFCVDREKHRLWQFTPITDKFIREYFAKDGIIECNHEEMGEPSIWFADFMACSLLEYVMNNYLERQSDEEFKDKIVRDGTIMIPAMEKEMNRCLENFNQEHFDEDSIAYLKPKYDKMPVWIEIAKKMYQYFTEKELRFWKRPV